MYDIKGFVIGTDLYGRLKKVLIKKQEQSIPIPDSFDPSEFQIRGLVDLKMVSLDYMKGKKKVDGVEWIGDVDSCQADEITRL